MTHLSHDVRHRVLCPNFRTLEGLSLPVRAYHSSVLIKLRPCSFECGASFLGRGSWTWGITAGLVLVFSRAVVSCPARRAFVLPTGVGLMRRQCIDTEDRGEAQGRVLQITSWRLVKPARQDISWASGKCASKPLWRYHYCPSWGKSQRHLMSTCCVSGAALRISFKRT